MPADFCAGRVVLHPSIAININFARHRNSDYGVPKFRAADRVGSAQSRCGPIPIVRIAMDATAAVQPFGGGTIPSPVLHTERHATNVGPNTTRHRVGRRLGRDRIRSGYAATSDSRNLQRRAVAFEGFVSDQSRRYSRRGLSTQIVKSVFGIVPVFVGSFFRKICLRNAGIVAAAFSAGTVIRSIARERKEKQGDPQEASAARDSQSR